MTDKEVPIPATPPRDSRRLAVACARLADKLCHCSSRFYPKDLFKYLQTFCGSQVFGFFSYI